VWGDTLDRLSMGRQFGGRTLQANLTEATASVRVVKGPTWLLLMVPNVTMRFSDMCDSVGGLMRAIVTLHDFIWLYLILVLAIVAWMLGSIMYTFGYADIYRSSGIRKAILTYRPVVHAPMLELFWTLTPSLILICIATPMFATLYAMESVYFPQLTFKLIGHQWFWSYEYFGPFEFIYPGKEDTVIPGWRYAFDSNLVYETGLRKGEHRLLQVDMPLVIPAECPIRFLITSTDVLHSWTIPQFGIKVDACPGRLNQAFFIPNREGVFYGQCSELCGVNHGFMPIMVNVTVLGQFNDFVGFAGGFASVHEQNYEAFHKVVKL